MQFMVRIDVRLPGDWPEQRLAEMVEAEMARGNELMREGTRPILFSKRYKVASETMPQFSSRAPPFFY